MAVKFPDITEHNNPNNAQVDSNFVRGGRRSPVADLTALYALASKVDQLKEHSTIVYVNSEAKEYKLVNIADITSGVFNPTAWILYGGTFENPLTFNSPLSRATNTISIPVATSSVNGYLSSTDWITFNSKAPINNPTFTGTATAFTLKTDTITTATDNSTTGAPLFILGDDASTTGGDIAITPGSGANGGALNINGGSATNGNGGSVNITSPSGLGTNKNAGNIKLNLGAATGSGTDGRVIISSAKSTSTGDIYLDVDNVTSNRNISFPNTSGTLAIDSELVHLAGAETITGLKTFNTAESTSIIDIKEIGNLTKRTEFQAGNLIMYGGTSFPNYTTSVASTQITLTNSGSGSQTNIAPNGVTTPYTNIKTEGGSFAGTLQTPTLTDNRTYTFPNTSGTVALTSNQTFTGTNTFTGDLILSNYDGLSVGKDLAIANSTGLTSDGLLTVNADTSKFDLAAGTGEIIDYATNPTNPTINKVSWSAMLANTVTNIATADKTYILVNGSGAIVQQITFPTASERRSNIFIGSIIHPNHSTIQNARTIPDFNQGIASQVFDFFDALGAFNVSGNKISPNGANLSFNKSAGYIFRRGAYYQNDDQNPHVAPLSAGTPQSFIKASVNAQVGSSVTVVDPANYDVSGTITAIPGGSNTSSIQRVYAFSSGLVFVQYGQNTYSSLADAKAAISTESFTINPAIADGGVLLGYIVLTKGCTNLSDSGTCAILPAPRFDVGSGGGASSTTTMQGAYNNSATPQITTTTTLGAVDFKRGSAADTDDVFRILNGAGTATTAFKGNGDISINGDITSLGGNYIDVWNAASTDYASISGTNISMNDNVNNYVTLHPEDIEFSTTGNYVGKLVSGSTTTGGGVTWTLPNATGTLAATLTTTSSLDFPSTGASTHSDLTVTLTGAALGDVVMLGVPHGSVTANSCYTAWVSATNTVTVRLNNYDSVSATDPSSGTFRVSIIKY